MSQALTGYYKRIIRRQIQSGRFSSEGEVVRHSLSLLDAIERAAGPVGSSFSNARGGIASTRSGQRRCHAHDDKTATENLRSAEENLRVGHSVAKPEVDEDLIAHAKWIELDNPDAAERFLEAAFKSFEFLASFPEAGPKARFKHQRLKEFRFWVLPPPFNRWARLL